MPSPTSATLTGPASGNGGVPSTNFTAQLDQVADPGGVLVTPASSVVGDTFSPTSFTIPAGQSNGTFQVTPSTVGSRNISITTSPSLTLIGSPKAYNSLGNCPDNAGATNQFEDWSSPTVSCPPTFSVSYTITPTTLPEKDMYCSTSPITLSITE